MTVLEPTTDPGVTPPFDEARVAEAMHAGVLTCPVDTPLRTVARMMAAYRVHCVIVTDHPATGAGEDKLWGVVSDLDLVGGLEAGDADERTAGEAAATPIITVSPEETLARAAQLMVEHGTTHLVVADPESGLPVGILSTLDVARVVAGAPREG